MVIARADPVDPAANEEAGMEGACAGHRPGRRQLAPGNHVPAEEAPPCRSDGGGEARPASPGGKQQGRRAPVAANQAEARAFQREQEHRQQRQRRAQVEREGEEILSYAARHTAGERERIRR